MKSEKKTDGVILMLAAFPAAVAGCLLLIGETVLAMDWMGMPGGSVNFRRTC